MAQDPCGAGSAFHAAADSDPARCFCPGLRGLDRASSQEQAPSALKLRAAARTAAGCGGFVVALRPRALRSCVDSFYSGRKERWRHPMSEHAWGPPNFVVVKQLSRQRSRRQRDYVADVGIFSPSHGLASN